MHLWNVTFRVGDFGTKRLTVTTEERAAAGQDDFGQPVGGFAQAEYEALKAAQSETNGWPTPIELAAIEYVDELPAVEPPKPKGRRSAE